MRTAITLNGNPSPSANYVSWAPSPAQIRLADPTGATGPVAVTLRNQRTDVGGQLVFFSALSGTGQDTLQLTLPVDGSPVPFFAAGRFGRASVADKDAAIQVVTSAGVSLSVTQLMVRVRKNANLLNAAERTRFLAALASFNNRGLGRFIDIRDMHRDSGLDEAHGDAGFLPWHRAYLLDLERELQNIDPSVALPYWRFDQPAPNLFTREFLGVSNSNGTLQFSTTNPLQFWRTDQGSGINRRPLFSAATQPASSPGFPLLNELSTLNIGRTYVPFRNMEFNPHNRAHTSFTGDLRNPDTAPKDPLFFLLHNNVDRLWAKWQWINRRFDGASTDSYRPQGSAGSPGTTRIGHNSNDTMWPWNQNTTFPRPSTAPGGTLARSVCATSPSPSPAVRDMLDYQGVRTAASRIGFSYDDVPFQF